MHSQPGLFAAFARTLDIILWKTDCGSCRAVGVQCDNGCCVASHHWTHGDGRLVDRGPVEKALRQKPPLDCLHTTRDEGIAHVD